MKGQHNLFNTELPKASWPALAFMYIVHKKPSNIHFSRKTNKKASFAALEIMAKFDVGLESTALLK